MDPQQARIYSTVVITAIILGFIILFFIISIIRQQRRTLRIQKQSVQLQMNALEKDRARIASDLHDELGPMLSAVKMKINSFELPDEDDQAEMVKTSEHLDVLLKRIREITFDLMPNTLLRKGLAGAAREFVEYMGHHSKIDIRYTADDIGPLNEQKTVNLYRILQEVVHNTVKHAGASVLSISISRKKDIIVLSTSDNGAGFDYDKKLSAEEGIGLKSLKSRVEIMNGDLYLESKRGKGTSYIFQIPV